MKRCGGVIPLSLRPSLPPSSETSGWFEGRQAGVNVGKRFVPRLDGFQRVGEPRHLDDQAVAVAADRRPTRTQRRRAAPPLAFEQFLANRSILFYLCSHARNRGERLSDPISDPELSRDRARASRDSPSEVRAAGPSPPRPGQQSRAGTAGRNRNASQALGKPQFRSRTAARLRKGGGPSEPEPERVATRCKVPIREPRRRRPLAVGFKRPVRRMAVC